MNVSEVMTVAVRPCAPDDSLHQAAQIMWDHDCGVVPVVDAERHVVGVITDRDICMAGYIQGQPLQQIPVARVMSGGVHGVRETDLVEAAETLMRQKQVRRLPVLDREGRLAGILSMSDLARKARMSAPVADAMSGASVLRTLAAVSEPRARARIDP